MMSFLSNWPRVAAQVLVGCAVLLLWEGCIDLFHVSADKIAAPSVILATIWSNRDSLASAVATTSCEAVTGLLAGILIGVLSGVAFCRWRMLERMFLPYFVGSQAVPIIAFGAIIIMWFGNGIASKALIAFYLSFFPIAVNTLAGMRTVGSDRIGLLRSFGANPLAILLKLQLPAALPSIFTAIRLGASLALVGAMVGEWFGATKGIGVVLLTAMFDYRIPLLWAAIVLTGLTGAILFGVVAFMQKRIAWWQAEA
jgi:NitT/TauT family transport system permease protein